MTPPTRQQSPDIPRHRLARVACLGYQNVGRGAVVVFSDAQRSCSRGGWLGTEYPYFVQDCLLRRLIEDVWLRHRPTRCSQILSNLVQQISSYDPAEGMVVVVLSAAGDIWIRHIRFDGMKRVSSAAA